MIEGLSNHSSGDNMHEKKGNHVTIRSNGEAVFTINWVVKTTLDDF